MRDDAWFSTREEPLGVQPVDDNVFRQGFLFSETGDYVITAAFESEGKPYIVDFPLRVGEPAAIGPVGIALGVLIIVLVGVNIVQPKHLASAKIRGAHKSTRPPRP